MKYIGRYKVLKEQRIKEKIEFIKQNFPPGTCSEVKKTVKVNVIAIELIVFTVHVYLILLIISLFKQIEILSGFVLQWGNLQNEK